MIWLKLSFLALAASLCDSDSLPDSYLVYAMESELSVDFYMTNLNLRIPKKVLSFSKKETDLETLILSRNGNGLILYWSNKHCPTIRRYQFTENRTEAKELSEDNSVFLGVGYNEKIYLYSPNSRIISVYDYDSGVKLQEIDNFQDSNAIMHGADVNPLNRDDLLFAECSDDKFKGRVYNIINRKNLWSYEHNLPKCFDIWRITPNGERVFAVAGNEIYLSATKGAPFVKYHTSKELIVGLAVENNVLFYSTKEKKIFRMATNCTNIVQTHIDVRDSVNMMALYTPKRYLVYATENDKRINFYKTDFDFCSSTYHHGVLKLGNLSLDRMFFGYNESHEMLFWSYKSDKINYVESYNFLRRTLRMSPFDGSNYKFLGIGNNDTTYHFSPKSKNLRVYSHTSNIHLNLKVLKDISTDMHCVDINPLNREQLFFAECTESRSTGKVFDVKEQKVLDNYNQPLPVCFDTWRITPNGKKAYAVKDNKIYLSPSEGAPFEEYKIVDKNIQAFAVGNNELFYSTSESGKIFKLTPALTEGGYFTSEINVQKNVKALAVYEE